MRSPNRFPAVRRASRSRMVPAVDRIVAIAQLRASHLVREYINKRGGFLSEKSGHEGIAEILEIISTRAP